MGKHHSFKPCVVYDAMGFVRQLWLAAHRDKETVTLVMSDTTKPYLFTREVMIGQVGPLGYPARYIISDMEPATLAANYKDRALKYGATPEAIRLLGAFVPIKKEELNIMAKADKLAPKKGNAEELKKAAAAAPVGGKKAAPAEKPAKTNNGGLEKARAAATAKRDAFAESKITLLVKSKDTTLRGGRLAKLQAVEAAKPKKVGDVLGLEFDYEGETVKIDTGALRGMEKREHIKIG